MSTSSLRRKDRTVTPAAASPPATHVRLYVVPPRVVDIDDPQRRLVFAGALPQPPVPGDYVQIGDVRTYVINRRWRYPLPGADGPAPYLEIAVMSADHDQLPDVPDVPAPAAAAD